MRHVKTPALIILLLSLGIGTAMIYPAAVNGSTVTTSTYRQDRTLSLRQNMPVLAYNVTAVGQCGANNSGPEYVVVGLSNRGYWYTVGLAWNYPSGYNPLSISYGTWAVYSVYGTDGVKFEAASRLGNINDQDILLLRLSFSNDMVVMYLHDWYSSLTSQESYSAFGATEFVGTPNSPTDSNAFFTGLLSRQNYDGPYYGDQQAVVYRSSNPLSSSWMRITEYEYPGGSLSLFDTRSLHTYDNPYLLQNLTSNGAFVASNAFEFVTGRLSTATKCEASRSPSLLERLSPYWYAIPLIIVALLAPGIIWWVRRHPSGWPLPSPQPTGPVAVPPKGYW